MSSGGEPSVFKHSHHWHAATLFSLVRPQEPSVAHPSYRVSRFHPATIRRFQITGDRAAHRRSVLLAFAGLGFHVGIWTVVLAVLIAALSLSTRTLGLALSVLATGGIMTLIAGGQTAHRVGHRAILVVGVAGTGCFFLVLARVETWLGLFGVFLLGGAAAGCYDLGVNALGGDFERLYRRRQMNVFHAMFSFGAAFGAICAGLTLTVGWHYQTTFVATGTGLVILSLFTLIMPLPATERHLPTPDHQESRSPARMFSLGVVFAASIVVLAFLTDASLEGYVSYYLRTLLGSGPLLGAIGIATYHLAVAFGRLGGGAILCRVGERALLIGSGIGGAIGLLVAISTSTPAVASLGLLIVGVALSPVAPVAFSLAARSSPGREGRAVSLVTIAAYGVFLLGPAIIGGLAAATSLRIAWLLPIGGLLALSVASRRAPADLFQGDPADHVNRLASVPSPATSKE
jgi:MFS family permease